jgi:23S rRNA pseudouridine955/2504/2580 synthase
MTRKLCRSGEIRINSKRCSGTDVLKAGDLIRIPPIVANKQSVPQRKTEALGFSLQDLEKLRQSIIHHDEDIVVFNKPAGLASQGGNGIKKSLDKMAQALLPNDTVLLVHRLDRETSGVIVLALNQMAAQKLSKAFQTKEVRKEYIAALSGKVSPKQGEIAEPVDGKKAITVYKVLGELKNTLTFVRFFPMTGRKHQLRRHSAHSLGAPIVGDELYGGRSFDGKLKTLISTKHLYLFASKITFRHPRTEKPLTISATMPEWMRQVADLCEIEI